MPSRAAPRPSVGAETVGVRKDVVRNRRRIIDAAVASFRELGSDAQMDDIARRAGLGVATIYRYFANREELLRQVSEEVSGSLLDAAHHALELDDPWEGVVAVVTRFVEVNQEYRQLMNTTRALSTPLVASPPPSFGTMQSSVEAVLERAKAAGVLRADIDGRHISWLTSSVTAIPATSGRELRHHTQILQQLILDALRSPSVG